MKKLQNAEIISQTEVAPGIRSMILAAPHVAQTARPGQFIEIAIDDGAHILPRPLSICHTEASAGHVRIVYGVKGKGTAWLAKRRKGESLRVTGPLGKGFTLSHARAQAVAGGGIGIPPLLMLCKQIKAACPDGTLTAYLGFRADPFLTADFEALGITVKVATDDGTAGFHGNVAQLVAKEETPLDMLYACGPAVMLSALAAYADRQCIPCQVSLEEKMGCGIGACMSCAVRVKSADRIDGWAYQRVCAEGPVFDSKAVYWHD